jgi:hypothetical protein
MRSSQKHEPSQIKQEGDRRSLESRDADANWKDFDSKSKVGKRSLKLGGYENQGVYIQIRGLYIQALQQRCQCSEVQNFIEKSWSIRFFGEKLSKNVDEVANIGFKRND